MWSIDCLNGQGKCILIEEAAPAVVKVDLDPVTAGIIEVA